MSLAVTVVCSDPRNHIWPKIENWCYANGYQIVERKDSAKGGDLLLLVSCTEIVEKSIRDRYRKTLVIHESDLPAGRGWSPFAWQILDGKDEITVTLLEAADAVDSGDIWHQEVLVFEGHELSDELNAKRDACRLRLAQWAVMNFETVKPRKQAAGGSYYARRTPADSRIDPYKPLSAQFELLRIVEPRFPAFFEFRGHRYELEVRKAT